MIRRDLATQSRSVWAARSQNEFFNGLLEAPLQIGLQVMINTLAVNARELFQAYFEKYVSIRLA